MNVFGREPVLWLAFVTALVNLFVGFGLNLTAEQVALVNAFAAAAIGLYARRKVQPVGGSD